MAKADERWTTHELDGMSVLLVDDHDDSRGVIAEFLRFHGAVITAVPSVRAALAALAAMNFDALVSDIRMPDATGYELMQQVRGLAGPKAKIPAIAITAYTEMEGRDEALAAGFDDYMPKMSIVRLLRALAALRDRGDAAPRP